MRLGPRLSMDLTGSVLRLDVHGIRKQFPRGLLDVLAFYQEPHTLEEGLQFLVGPPGAWRVLLWPSPD